MTQQDLKDAQKQADAKRFVDAFNDLSYEAHENAATKGFWKDYYDLQEVAGLAFRNIILQMRRSQLRDLMYSELGEACEGDRKNLQSEKIPGFSNAEEEYADLLIRLADMNAGLGLRIAEAVVAKMAYNQGREAMHGGKAF